MGLRDLLKQVTGTAPAVNTINAAGGTAYAMEPKHALAQLAATGCFGGTYYTDAEAQLREVLALCGQLDPEYVAKTALYARNRGMMKDMPAVLCGYLSAADPELFVRIFPRVTDSGAMLRNFVQVIRSGICGRRSLGTVPKRMVRNWFAERDPDAVFFASGGTRPSFADILRLAHPRPDTPEREALYKWLLGRRVPADSLPPRAGRYLAWKQRRAAGETGGELPDAPFLWLMGCSLTITELRQLVRRLSWTALRMNILALARKGVFTEWETARYAAERLADPQEIARARAFPYQMFQTACMLCGSPENSAAVPKILRRAAVRALDITIENAPLFSGKKVYVLTDVSGSMSSPVTGWRKGASTAVRCVDAAALTASAIAQKNPGAEIIAFGHNVVEAQVDVRQGVFACARKLASFCGGGTNISAPLRHLNARSARGELVVYISDNESWMDSGRGGIAAETMRQWEMFARRNPGAKMVCLDLQPNTTTQAAERADILNLGGFSDAVFERMTAFADGAADAAAENWTESIEAIQL